jgi:hypothetical protein
MAAAFDASLIANLGPLAGAGLAINLSYLALDRFRYRGQIEPEAEKKCLKNDEEGSFEGFDSLDAVRELKWLARREKSEVFVPRGRGAIVYRFLYRKHQDVYFAVVAAAICAFILTAGVALGVGRWNWAKFLVTAPIPGILFYLCIIAMIAPGGFIALGRRCAKWGKYRIGYCTHQVAISLGNLAQQAKPPEGLAQPAPPPRQGPERLRTRPTALVVDPLTGELRHARPGEI